MFRFGSDRLPVPFIFILSRIRLLNFTDTGTVPSFMESFRSRKNVFFMKTAVEFCKTSSLCKQIWNPLNQETK